MASGARLPWPDPDKPKVRWITPNTIMIDIIKLRRARQASACAGRAERFALRPQEDAGVWA